MNLLRHPSAIDQLVGLVRGRMEAAGQCRAEESRCPRLIPLSYLLLSIGQRFQLVPVLIFAYRPSCRFQTIHECRLPTFTCVILDMISAKVAMVLCFHYAGLRLAMAHCSLYASALSPYCLMFWCSFCKDSLMAQEWAGSRWLLATEAGA